MIRHFFILIEILTLSACATPEVREVRRPVELPAELRTCAPSPAVTDAETRADVARDLVRLCAAGQDCLETVAEIVEDIDGLNELH